MSTSDPKMDNLNICYYYRVGKRSKSISSLDQHSASLSQFIEYWRAIASGIHFFNMSLEKCLHAIHKDIITIWNFRDEHEV